MYSYTTLLPFRVFLFLIVCATRSILVCRWLVYTRVSVHCIYRIRTFPFPLLWYTYIVSYVLNKYFKLGAILFILIFGVFVSIECDFVVVSEPTAILCKSCIQTLKWLFGMLIYIYNTFHQRINDYNIKKKLLMK